MPWKRSWAISARSLSRIVVGLVLEGEEVAGHVL